MTTPATISFVKGQSADGTQVEVAELTDVRQLRIEFTFQQQPSGGLLGRARDRMSAGVDPDLYLFAFQGQMPVDFTSAKDSRGGMPAAPSGAPAVRIPTDASRGGSEIGFVDLDALAERFSYITSFGVGVLCAKGMNRIPGAVAHFIDATGGQDRHIASTPFDVRRATTGAVVGAIVKKGTAWQFMKVSATGGCATWMDLANLLAVHVPA